MTVVMYFPIAVPFLIGCRGSESIISNNCSVAQGMAGCHQSSPTGNETPTTRIETIALSSASLAQPAARGGKGMHVNDRAY